MRCMTLVPGLLVLGLAACGGDSDSGEPVSLTRQAVAYEHDGVTLTGYLVKPDGLTEKRPGILVIHEWWGLDEHPRQRAEELARLGYVAFCCDMYGEPDAPTDDPAQAGAWAGAFYGDKYGFGRARVRAGLDVLAADPDVDPERLAAIGFCYGGSVALELAWSGAPVRAVVSFHGNPAPPRPEDVPGVRAAVLVCHGGADPLVPPETIEAYEQGLEGTDIVHRIETYEGAKHAFTNPGADARGMDAIGYHEEADKASWAHMRAFFAEYLEP
ncbi:MAG: dienelactone hydrolase family protein [Planctomycetota bacterium]|jgi:dienelactone hydrolase